MGWASWRRAWALNRPVYENFNQLSPLKISLSSNQEVNKMWWRRIGNTINHKIDTLDYLWTFTNLINNGLTIIPKKTWLKISVLAI